jgi:hypothetical protein
MPGFELFGREHPAFVHLPIAASLLLPVALFLRRDEVARFLAWAGLAGGAASLASGLLWARGMGFIAPGAWLGRGPLLTHEVLALTGFAAGLLALFLLYRPGRRPALAAALLWAGLWGAAGHWGGRMVFPDPGPDVAQAHLSPESSWAT